MQDKMESILKEISNFKIQNRRILNSSEISELLKANKIAVLDFRRKKEIQQRATSGLNLEELKIAYPDSNEILNANDSEFLKNSYHTAFKQITSNFYFLCDDECAGPKSLEDELDRIKPRLEELCSFMTDRGIEIDDSFFKIWYKSEEPTETPKLSIEKRIN